MYIHGAMEGCITQDHTWTCMEVKQLYDCKEKIVTIGNDKDTYFEEVSAKRSVCCCVRDRCSGDVCGNKTGIRRSRLIMCLSNIILKWMGRRVC